jgi:hypothetical protein
MGTLRVETANSVWFFDEDRMLFRRVPRESVEVYAPTDSWQRYFGLEMDAVTGAFTVLLDPDGTRRYRSWRVEADEPTEEIPLIPTPDSMA